MLFGVARLDSDCMARVLVFESDWLSNFFRFWAKSSAMYEDREQFLVTSQDREWYLIMY